MKPTHLRHQQTAISGRDQAAIGDQLEVISLNQAGIDIEHSRTSRNLEATHRKIVTSTVTEATASAKTRARSGSPQRRTRREKRPLCRRRSHFSTTSKSCSTTWKAKRTESPLPYVISLILDGQEHLFEGICEGQYSPRTGEKVRYDPCSHPKGRASLPR